MLANRLITAPADDLVVLSNRLSGLLDNVLVSPEWMPREVTTTAWVPAVDVFEDADQIRVVAELPGVRPEDLRISLEGDVLTIQGTRKPVAQEGAVQVHRCERVYGAFERTFTLPVSVDAEKVQATYTLGVLTVTLPKREEAKPKQIKVEVTPEAQGLKAA